MIMHTMKGWGRCLKVILCGPRLAFFIVSIAACTYAWAQLTFQHSYGTVEDNEYGYSVVERTDGTLLIVGPDVVQVEPFETAGHGFMLRVAASGDSTGWEVYVPNNADLEWEHVNRSANGDFILSGVLNLGVFNGNSDFDAYVVKCDSIGQVLWSKSVGENNNQSALQSKPTPDGGIITAGGNTVTADPNDAAIYLIRFTTEGDTLWTHTYPSPTPWVQNAFCVSVLPDSGFAVGGSQNESDPRPLVMRTDPAGDTLWTRRMDELGQGEVRDLLVNGDGNIVTTGYCTATGYSTPYIVELNTAGEVLWSQPYDQFTAGWARGICATPDGYAIGGLTYQYDFFILKTDLAGNYQWHRTFDIGGDYGYSIISTSDGGFALAGYTSLQGTPGTQVVLIKTDGLGNVVTSTHDLNIDPTVTAALYPNPVDGTATLRYTLATGGRFTLVLHDGNGRLVRTYFSSKERGPGPFEETIDLTGLPPGTYTLVLSNGNQAMTVKALKL